MTLSKPRRTLPTQDPDAQRVNHAINPIIHRIVAGKLLKQILTDRFDNDVQEFKRWVRCNLDCSVKSAARFMRLADSEAYLLDLQLADLASAYAILGLNGNVINIPVENI